MVSGEEIAAIASADRATTESLLATVVSRASESGAKVVGLLAETPLTADQTCGAGVLRDITSKRSFSIRLSDRPAHTSCVLDVSGVAAAAASILERIAGCDLVVLSKFGKLEAAGSGLISVFEIAKGLRKPILTSVSGKHRVAWGLFAPGAVDVEPDEVALFDWCRMAVNR